MALRILRLEERLLFDASAAAVVAQAADGGHPADAHTDAHSADAQPAPATQTSDTSDHVTAAPDAAPVSEPVHVLVISSQVDHAQELANTAANGVVVVLYDAQSNLSDLSSQIQTALNGRLADSIAFATHGQSGLFKLTQDIYVTAEKIDHNPQLQQFWHDVGNMMKDGGRLDLLGCNIAANDFGLIDALHNQTGKDIAASTDATIGTDWSLEVGNIDASFYFNNASSWSGQLATFSVVTTLDSGAGSLRQAIIDANATVGTDTIDFSGIDVSNSSILSLGNVITLLSDLDPITEAVTIDGTVTLNNSYVFGTNMVAIDGFAYGFNITAANVTIKGLDIIGSTTAGIRIAGDNATIQSNLIGINLSGAAAGNQNGIQIDSGSTILIGGNHNANEGNIISGNYPGGGLNDPTAGGIQINGGSAITIKGNYIGTNVAGNAAVQNNGFGIYAASGTTSIMIGGSGTGEGNVVSGTHGQTLWLKGSNTTVQNNIIGLDANGNASIGNDQSGILIEGGSNYTIGGDRTLNQGNTLGGNVFGIAITGGGNITIKGNYIGTTKDGLSSRPNTADGIGFLSSVNNVTIGGTLAGERNIISSSGGLGNPYGRGIYIVGGDTYTIKNNIIGLDVTGTVNFGNVQSGIESNATNVTIGGTVGDRNFISGNTQHGIQITAGSATISNNYIGTDAGGTLDRGNTLDGINISGTAAGVTITSNVISGNNSDGIEIAAGSHTITGNFIGTNAAGAAAIANTQDGIKVSSGSQIIKGNIISNNGSRGINIVGGSNHFIGSLNVNFDGTRGIYLAGTNEGNVITNNTGNGIFVQTNNVTIQGNLISGNALNQDGNITTFGGNNITIQGNWVGLNAAGTDAMSTTPAGNVRRGISFSLFSPNLNYTIGGDLVSQRNVIAGNTVGIYMSANPSGIFPNFTINGNYIGTDVTGTAAIGNRDGGIDLSPSALVDATITNNVISGNTNATGISISNQARNVVILNNKIGTNVTGTAALANATGISASTSTASLTIGGTAGDRNYISGNTTHGISISAGSATISNNYIGTDIDGTVDLGNTLDGINISGTAAGVTITSNVISGNNSDGIEIAAGSHTIKGNTIGLNAAGTAAVANSANGIKITGGSNNVIGGTLTADRNIISGNTTNGISITGGSGHQILGNYIGLDVNGGGTAAIGNVSDGILVSGSGVTNVIIGGNSTDSGVTVNQVAGNFIANNKLAAGAGVQLTSVGTGIKIVGNTIGLNTSGTAAANVGGGIRIDGTNPGSVTIGGTGAGASNIIAYNGGDGITVSSGTGMEIRANSIFGNSGESINISAGANDSGNAPTVTFTEAYNFADQQFYISGSLTDPVGGRVFVVDFFANNQSGSIAKIYLGSVQVDTSVSSIFSFPYNQALSTFQYVTAVITEISTKNSTEVSSAQALQSGIIVVYNTNDSGAGSLRNAITSTNANAGTDTIKFSGLDVNSTQRINVTTDLPQIVEAVIIDGTTAQNFDFLNPFSKMVTLDGISNGFYINAANVTIKGMNIISSSNAGIFITAGNAVIKGNLIGSTLDGVANANETGIWINAGSGSQIGGTLAGDRNVISGNTFYGIRLSSGGGSNSGHLIQGNYIGLTSTGAALGNGQHGILISGSVTDVTIGAPIGFSGTDFSPYRNIISKNGQHGIHIDAGSHTIRGNYLGIDVNGGASLGTSGGSGDQPLILSAAGTQTISDNYIGKGITHGIDVYGGTVTILRNHIGIGPTGQNIGLNGTGIIIRTGADATIGGTTLLDANYIGFNNSGGLLMFGRNITVQNNFIGMNYTGTFSADGLSINTLGSISNAGNTYVNNGAVWIYPVGSITSLTISRNFIGFNSSNGILGDTSTGVNIKGNYIGVVGDVNGNTLAAGNTQSGIKIQGSATSWNIGGTAGDRNYISGNTTHGISISSGSATISNNYIGTDIGGTVDLGNTLDGINISGTATGLTISSNVISGNNSDGIEIAAGSHTITGNTIGLNAAGTTAVANSSIGINLGGTGTTTIGGITAADRNIISGNTSHGISLNNGSGTVNVLGNYIGLNAAGDTARANGGYGIVTSLAGVKNIGNGTAAGRNVISGNTGGGIQTTGVSSIVVNMNYIGTDQTGLLARGNSGRGISVDGSGGAQILNNIIAGNVNGVNAGNGILIQGGSTNVVQGNWIGLNAAGAVLANAANGIEFRTGATTTLVGGTLVSQRNVISGNALTGIAMTGGSGHTIQGNYIGTDTTGAADLGNTTDGINLSGASTTGLTITNNVISGNNSDGIEISAGSHTIKGNTIGLNATGTAAIANSANGINITAGSNNVIGGTLTADRNIISGNNTNGISITGGSGHQILGNYIGLDNTGGGTAAIGNVSDGILISGSGVTNVIIGGNSADSGVTVNQVSGNFIANNKLAAGAGIQLTGVGAGIKIVGNTIGLNTSGTAAANVGGGVRVDGTNPAAVTIGGTTASFRNIISGNTTNGINLNKGSGHTISNNYIGTDASGTLDRGNTTDGINISSTAAGVTISNNLISGNDSDGIEIAAGSHTIAGNIIGLNAAGTAAIANTGRGIIVTSAATGTTQTIDGTTAAGRNIVSGNGTQGILLVAGTSTIKGNYIGTDIGGTIDLGNVLDGVRLDSGTHTVQNNLISGNNNAGIQIIGGSHTITGNIIGLNAAGTAALANTVTGMFISSTGTQTIGGALAADRNIISGNTTFGIQITAGAATISNNYIGTDITGTVDLGNTSDGIRISAAGSVTVQNNIISGNNSDGIEITAGSHTIKGNTIGLTAAGTAAIANSSVGIRSSSTAAQTIGGTTAVDRNIISGNTSEGILISAGSGHQILGNYIGTDISGTVDLGNGTDGILMNTGSSSATISKNVISGNNGDGIQVNSSSAQTITGNIIGLAADGNGVLGNTFHGINIASTAVQNIDGTTAAGRNIISGNGQRGITISGTSGPALIKGNFIGTDISGTLDRGNLLLGIATFSSTAGGLIADNVISGNDTNGINITGGINTVTGNKIGTDVTGTLWLGNSVDGISISGGSNHVIGGTLASERNIISGNGGDGIDITGSTGTMILNNHIGTDTAGTAELGNVLDGINISGTATGVTITSNVISGNDSDGIEIAAGSHTIKGNTIGLNAAGTAVVTNTVNGILLTGGTNHIIGGTLTADRNIISGNADGVNITGGTGAQILGNYIGTDIGGTLDRGNTLDGINISGTAAGVTVSNNVLSGNNSDGIAIAAGSHTVKGNIIGLNAAGTGVLGNSFSGVFISGGTNTKIGGTVAGGNTLATLVDRNIISANGTSGININTGSGAMILGNYIGLDINGGGAAAIGNATNGIRLSGIAGVSNVIIGGDSLDGGITVNQIAANFVSNNRSTTDGGIRLQNVASGVKVVGNIVGLNVSGTAAPNAGGGITVDGTASAVTIGGTSASFRNIISGNTNNGISLTSGSGHTVINNYIGTDSGGTVDLGNTLDGISISGTAASITITSNVISGNNSDGIEIAAGSHTIAGNIIGLNAAGTAAIANTGKGISATSTATGTQTIDGTTAAGRNIISGNGAQGIVLNAGTSTIKGNYIGTDIGGTVDLGNVSDGVRSDGGTHTIQNNLISGNNNAGIQITAGSNTIKGNIIGLKFDGLSTLGNSVTGIFISSTGTQTIGGTIGDRNIISGNTSHGVSITTGSATIQGNYIGTDINGNNDLGNTSDGINISSTATGVQILNNVISGNNSDGIEMASDNTGSHTIKGNIIGLNAAGNAAIGNSSVGIRNASSGTQTIGGSNASDRNIISGSLAGQGIIMNVGTGTITNNYIGTDITGNVDLGNATDGILINGTAANISVTNNVISGNNSDGIQIDVGSHTIKGNIIGLTAVGNAALTNTAAGINITSTGTQNIGDGTISGRNIISGNGTIGINASAGTTVINNNLIGTDINGSNDLGNGLEGILTSATTSTISNSVISGNGAYGIRIGGGGTYTILGNIIGLNEAGDTAMGNGNSGVASFAPGSTLFVGDGTVVGRNVISASAGYGIRVTATGQATINNNYIGTDKTGTVAFGNTLDGINLASTAANGLVVSNNLVVGNLNDGIDIAGGSYTLINNIVRDNSQNGLNLTSTGTQTIGDGTDAGANTISANGENGISVVGGLVNIDKNYVIGNTQNGVSITGGGAHTILSNVISTNQGDGILISNGDGVSITANSIQSNTGDGIHLTGTTSNTLIGGTATSSWNTIAHNGKAGIHIEGATAVGNTIYGNTIFSNSGKGIFLENGANHGQLSPLPFRAILDAGLLTLKGIVDGSGAQYLVQFYSNDDTIDIADVEGQTYLGSELIIGSGPFSHQFDASLILNTKFISVTATNLTTGDTSAFGVAKITPPDPILATNNFSPPQSQFQSETRITSDISRVNISTLSSEFSPLVDQQQSRTNGFIGKDNLNQLTSFGEHIGYESLSQMEGSRAVYRLEKGEFYLTNRDHTTGFGSDVNPTNHSYKPYDVPSYSDDIQQLIHELLNNNESNPIPLTQNESQILVDKLLAWLGE